MEGVDAIGLDEMRDLARATDTGNDYGLTGIDVHLGEGHLDSVEDAKVAAVA